jgi:hypothetical protein
MMAKLGLSLVPGYIDLADATLGFVVIFAATALGAAVRYRAGVRTRELAQAKLLERERLARDLHDTVAHHVSAIAIRAQAGLATAQADPERGRRGAAGHRGRGVARARRNAHDGARAAPGGGEKTRRRAAARRPRRRGTSPARTGMAARSSTSRSTATWTTCRRPSVRPSTASPRSR